MTDCYDFTTTPYQAGPRVEERVRAVEDAGEAVADAEISAFVRDTAAVLGERDADLLDMHLRHGLTAADLVPDHGSGTDRALARTRGNFARALRARIVWNAGNPACEVLAGLLERAGIGDWDRGAAEVVDAHADGCPACIELRRTRVAPTTLYAALPLAAVPAGAKAAAASALAAAGVPMSGSAALAPAREAGAVSEVVTLEPPPWRRSEVRARVRTTRMARALLSAAAAVTLVAGAGAGVVNMGGGASAPPPEAAAVSSTPQQPAPATTGPEPRAASGGVDDATPSPPRRSRADAPATPGDPPGDGGGRSGAGQDTPEPAQQQQPKALAPPPRIQSFDASDGSVSWKVSGQGRVRVSGPGLSSSSMSGTKNVCPGGSGTGACVAGGSLTYQLQVFDAAGELVDRRSVSMRTG